MNERPPERPYIFLHDRLRPYAQAIWGVEGLVWGFGLIGAIFGFGAWLIG